jgi:hypothetical protein
MACDRRQAALLDARSITTRRKTMPVLLWLLGMPIGLIILLMLVGVA